MGSSDEFSSGMAVFFPVEFFDYKFQPFRTFESFLRKNLESSEKPNSLNWEILESGTGLVRNGERPDFVGVQVTSATKERDRFCIEIPFTNSSEVTCLPSCFKRAGNRDRT